MEAQRNKKQSRHFQSTLLFFNYPVDVMPYKRKIIRYLNFTEQMRRRMLKQYPQILVFSVSSFEQKSLFIRNRLKLKMDESNLELLTFNFNKTIRPCGEISDSLRQQVYYRVHETYKRRVYGEAQVANLKLNEEIAKYPISLKIDLKNGKLWEKLELREKVIQLTSVYQH